MVCMRMEEVRYAIRHTVCPCRHLQVGGLLKNAGKTEKVHSAGKRRRLEQSVSFGSKIATNIDQSRAAIPFSMSQQSPQALLGGSAILIEHLTDDTATACEHNLEVVHALPFAQCE